MTFKQFYNFMTTIMSTNLARASILNDELKKKQQCMSRILGGPEANFQWAGKCIGPEIFEAGRKFDQRIWQIDIASGVYESYGSMRERSVRLAIQMQTWGITNWDVVCACSGNNMENGIVAIGTFFIGASYAHIDPSLSSRDIQMLLFTLHPALIFTEEPFVHLIELAVETLDFTHKIVVLGASNNYDVFTDCQNPYPDEKKFVPFGDDVNAPALIICKSCGEENKAKAVVHSHASLMHIVHTYLNTGIDTSYILYFATLYWLPPVALFIAALLRGGCRLIAHTFKIDSIYSAIQYYGVRTIFIAPIFAFKLINNEHWKKFSTASVTNIITSGGPISNIQVQRLKSIFSKASILILYELSELGPICLYTPGPDKASRRGICGKLCGGVMGRVVDLSSYQILEPKSRGELCFKSESCMLGYFEESSQHAFDSDGYFRTGDIGYYDEDDNFYIIGRTKEIFKYMSWPIVPTIIERALLEHPSVYEAVVFGVPAEIVEMGELPTAWIVVKPGMNATAAELNKFINERITDNEKLRGGIFFKKNLPKSPNGKLLRKEIQNKYIYANAKPLTGQQKTDSLITHLSISELPES